MKKALLLLALCLPLVSQAAGGADNADPWAELDRLLELDQQSRQRLQELIVKGDTSSAEFNRLAEQQQAIDSANMARLAELLERHGWPGAGRASHAAFMIVQHAEPAVQRRYVPLMRQAQQRGDLSATELGMLEDRLLVREGQPQRYGSQLGTGPDGKLHFEPIEDEAHVDERRAAVGMEPMSTYARHFQLIYPPRAVAVAEGRCPSMPRPAASALDAEKHHLVARFLLRADGRIENIRVEGHGSTALKQAIAQAVAAYRCLPGDADQEAQALFSTL